MFNFMNVRDRVEEKREISIDSCIWRACAGDKVQIPAENSIVFYFPQGYAEHACADVDFKSCHKLGAFFPCQVVSIKYLVDSETDEVFAKMNLVPVSWTVLDSETEHIIDGIREYDVQEKANSFPKTLTQSDANNGGGFSVPRYCADNILDPLDLTQEGPYRNILAKDLLGNTFPFRHIYRGTPRRHLLTTGWSSFVNNKKLCAGDSIVFIRAANNDIYVGIRRTKRRNEIIRGPIKPEKVIEATNLASNGHPFEVDYYPGANTPEFIVKASLVKAAIQLRWNPGTKVKINLETGSSSLEGSVSSVQVVDPILFPDSPWRILQVKWDVPDSELQRVNPWAIELVAKNPFVYTPPQKKLRVNFPNDGPLPVPAFSGTELVEFDINFNNFPVGIQGSRQIPLPNIHQQDRFYPGFDTINTPIIYNPPISEATRKPEKVKTFVLFGKTIEIKEQVPVDNIPSNGNAHKTGIISDGLGFSFPEQPSISELSNCEVFLDTEDMGYPLNLQMLWSYEELYKELYKMLYKKLGNMVGDKRSYIFQYRDVSGAMKPLGEEPFTDIVAKARRLIILTNSSRDDTGINPIGQIQ